MIDQLLTGLYTASQMRAMDEAAIDGVGIPGGHLMERAGAATAVELLERYDPGTAVVYCGKGNNGGDGLVVARELLNEGIDVSVYAVAGKDAYSGDAQLNLRVLTRLGVQVHDGLPGRDDPARFPDLIVDAVFGTGFSGEPRGPGAAAIELIEATPAPVVSVDIASGVDGSTGEVAGPVVTADLTVTFQESKVGHFVMPGAASAGEVVVVPIGIPRQCQTEPEVCLLGVEGLSPLLRTKGLLDHKRSVGTVLVLGGSRGMAGAAFLTAMGALRSGAGLVHCAVPSSAAADKPFVEVITTPLADEHCLSIASLEAVDAQIADMKAMAVGPGLGRAPETVALVRALVGWDVPVVIDADGLWALGDEPELLAQRRAPAVLTPHEGEIARLLGKRAGEVAAHRLASVREAARRSGAVVLLKGEASVVAGPEGRVYVIPTGNPGLATPGTGDVLTGAVVAQLAKGLPAIDAACVGGYVHGLAADLAADLVVGTECMIASDLFDFLPPAMECLKQTDAPGAGEEE